MESRRKVFIRVCFPATAAHYVSYIYMRYLLIKSQHAEAWSVMDPRYKCMFFAQAQPVIHLNPIS